MQIIEAKLSEIMFDNSDYHFNQALVWNESDQYLQSLKSSFFSQGIIEPIVLHQKNGTKHLVHGYNRYCFAKKNNIQTISAIVFNETIPTENIFEFLLNTHFKKLSENTVAKVLFVQKAINSFCSRHFVLKTILPSLEFEADERVLKNIESTARLPRELLDYCEQKKYSFRQIFYLTRFPIELVNEVFSWRNDLHFSASIFDEVLTQLKDYLRFSNESLSSFKTRDEFTSIFSNSGELQISPQMRTERLRKWLRGLRYPILTKTQKELELLKGELNLPHTVNLTWDPALENGHLELKIKVRDSEELEKTFNKLSDSKTHSTFNRIFEHL